MTGSFVFWLALIALVYVQRRSFSHQAAVVLGFALLLEFAVVELLLKPWIERPRPFWELELTQVLDPVVSSFSFPSGHVTSVAAAGWVITRYYPRSGWLWVLLALVVAWSRMYNGVHWPSDVLAGALLGVALGWLSYVLTKRHFSPSA